jgi:hypothetical protein
MSVDNAERDYHLTPAGWMAGDFRLWGKNHNNEPDAPIPSDRVLTLTHRTYQRDRFSQEERSVIVRWRGEISDEDLFELRKQFSSPFPAEDE